MRTAIVLAATLLSGCAGHDPAIEEASKQYLRELHALSCEELKKRAQFNDERLAAIPGHQLGPFGPSDVNRQYALLKGENDRLAWIAVRHKECQPAKWWIWRMADDARYPAWYERHYPYY